MRTWNVIAIDLLAPCPEVTGYPGAARREATGTGNQNCQRRDRR
jgi:hypothetical protein